MTIKKFGIILFLSMLLVGMVLVPAVNAQKENNYNVTVEKALNMQMHT